MDDQLKKLEALLAVLGENTVTMEEFSKNFEIVIDFAKETRDLTDLEIEKIRTGYNATANQIKDFNGAEWAKIKQKVDALKNGDDYVLTESDKQEIASQITVPVVEKTIEKTTIIKEQPIVKEVAVTDLPDEIVQKINTSKKLISQDRVEGLKDIANMARANQVPVTTSFFNGLRAKNLMIVGGSAYQQGDTVYVTPSSSSGTISPTTPSGTIDSSNTAFVFSVKPNLIVSDGATYRENFGWTWSGSTATMSVPPQFDLFGL